MGRLSLDISDQQHKNLKALAALEGKSIGQFAIERLLPAEWAGEQPLGELKDFINSRIASGLAGDISPLSFDEIVNEEFARGAAQ